MEDKKDKHENEYDLEKPQYKKDMQREEKNYRKIGKRFKDCTGFSKVCKQALS